MKVCVYCNSTNDDNAKKCSKCNASEFRNVCNNCQTVFSSGFCPTCGMRAGETAKVCSNCGTKTFSLYCPSCGTNLGKSPSSQKEAPVQLNNAVVSLPHQEQIHVTTNVKKVNNGLMVVLTVFFPFICSWIIFFSPKFSRGMRTFAFIYTVAMSLAILVSSHATVTALTIMLAPVVGFGIKLIVDKIKAK